MGDALEEQNSLSNGQQNQRTHTSFPVVGIGASAGGLQALKRFFEGLPADSGMAFVVIMHLSPEHESHAAAILQNTTRMNVTQVNESVKVEPNHVYVIPPTKHLAMEDGIIRLSAPTRPVGRHVAVDLFFRTLADTHQTRAVCVILSGTGADGSVGVKRVKEAGGVAIAQDPQDAEYDAMPRNAINTGMIDFVLPVVEMPEKLIELWRNMQQIQLPVEAEAPIVDESQAAENALRDVLGNLRTRTGHDFTHYKRATILRRIERRMQVNTIKELSAYRDFLRATPAEAQPLLKDLLIGVTNFFRDRAAFDSFEREVVPLLFEGKRTGDVVRVWCGGCATGEEAYSVAMLLLEQAARMQHPPEIQVFATDIDEDAIAAARIGIYPEAIEADVAPTRLRQFFTKEAGGYRVNKEVGERILFAVHNLIKDPPFSKLDAVTCRNLLIYLNREVQEQVFELFHFALRPGGFIFLGSSESTDGAADLFAPVNKKHRLFRAQAVARQARVVPVLPLEAPASRARGVATESASPGDALHERRRIAFGELHQQMVEQYAPPSLIVNAECEIVHLSENVGRYLRRAGGEPSVNVVKEVLPELRLELRTALFQAMQTGRSTEARRVSLELEGHRVYVNMVVRPSRAAEGEPGYALVLFIETEETLGEEGKELPDDTQDAVVSGLEEESQQLKDQLQATIEQYETTVEELKSSNEEMQSVNEELRSTGEELETSKEELQSVNEELRTVNQELKNKVEEVSEANADLKNLIASTEIATVFLDRSLRIKRYTPRATEIFSLIPTDLGRPLADITHRLEYENLHRDAEEVIATLRKVEREVRSADHRFFLARFSPYRTIDDRIDGVIISFIDVTEREEAAQLVRAERAYAEAIVETVREPLIILDKDLRVISASRSFYENFKVSPEETVGEYLYDLGSRQWDIPALRKLLEDILPSRTQFQDYEVEHRFESIGQRTMLLNAREIRLDGKGRRLILLAIADISERKRAEEALRESEAQLATELADTKQLQTVSSQLIREDDVNALYKQILNAAVWLMRSEMGSLQMFHPERNALELLAYKGFHPESAAFWKWVSVGEKSTCGEALEKGGRAITPDVETDETIAGTEDLKHFRLSGIRAVQSTPLISRGGNVVGMISTHWRDPHQPLERELRAFDVLARQAADLIERKRAEEELKASAERLRTIFEASRDGILVEDDERIIYVNQAYARLFGYEAAEELIGKHVSSIIAPEDTERLLEFGKSRIRGALPSSVYEFKGKRKDGTLIEVEASVSISTVAGRALITTMIRDITARKRAEEALKRLNEELEGRVQERTIELTEINNNLQKEITERKRAEQERVQILRRLVMVQEDERRRIALDMHDQFGQQLTALLLRLSTLKEDCGEQRKLREQIKAAETITRQLDTDIDFLIWELRPTVLDDLGLEAAMTNYVQNWSQHFGLSVELQVSGMKDERLTLEIETVLYRIVQEALNNVAKHAQASSVDIIFDRRADNVSLIIEDDGKGFDIGVLSGAGDKGLGIAGMRERAALVGGTILIETHPGDGATIIVRIPVSRPENEGHGADE